MQSWALLWQRDKYGDQKKKVLSAIAFHTTGKPDMSLLEKIVYIADYIEPRQGQGAKSS